MNARGPKSGTRKASARKPVVRVSEAAAAPKPDTKKAGPVPVGDAPAMETQALPAPVELSQEAVTKDADFAPVDETVPADSAVPTPIVEEAEMIHTNDPVETVVNPAQNLLGDMNERAKAAMEKGAKGVEEMNDMAKGNVEAFVEAGRIAAKGLETIGQDAAEYGRKTFENATATMKTMATVKSPTEFMKLQGDFMRQSFDAFVAEASKNTEAMLKLASDAAQPISNRVALTVEKVKMAA